VTGDIQFMNQALALAQQGTALTSPGAMVGAVVVAQDRIVGTGFYTYDDVLHAELKALQQAGPAARGATMYTTLEPCSHHGRTGPCAAALIQAGIQRVVTATVDPNPQVNGGGIAMLRSAGIEVHVGLLEQEALRLNEAFIVYKTRLRPFGILKIAMTFDGKIAARSGESKWITSEESRARVQQIRHQVDAIVTGSGTFLKDRPELTDRSGLPRRRPLLRVILDRRHRIEHAAGFLVFRDSLRRLCDELHRHEIQSFMLECGPDLAFDALQTGIIDKIVAFVAPAILGGREFPAVGGHGFGMLADRIELSEIAAENAGPDLMLTAYVRHPELR
jgi:diaminohydroxyphosphoribosylaminopyrimidine deaminase / 5-amino-6-(5-phosphoribosylamino)uracil reductase